VRKNFKSRSLNPKLKVNREKGPLQIRDEGKESRQDRNFTGAKDKAQRLHQGKKEDRMYGPNTRHLHSNSTMYHQSRERKGGFEVGSYRGRGKRQQHRRGRRKRKTMNKKIQESNSEKRQGLDCHKLPKRKKRAPTTDRKHQRKMKKKKIERSREGILQKEIESCTRHYMRTPRLQWIKRKDTDSGKRKKRKSGGKKSKTFLKRGN